MLTFINMLDLLKCVKEFYVVAQDCLGVVFYVIFSAIIEKILILKPV